MKKQGGVLILIIALAISTAGFSQWNLDSGAVGFYPFSGNALDSSSQAPINNGNLVGAFYSDCGIVGKNISFDGVNDRVKLNTNFDLDNDFSFSIWIKPERTHEGTIFSMRSQCTSTNRGWSKFTLMLSGNNSLGLLNGNPSLTVSNQLTIWIYRAAADCATWSNAYIYTVPGVEIDTTCYTHVAIAASDNSNNTNRSFDFYINGQYYPSVLCNTPPPANINNSVDPFDNSLTNYATYFGVGHDNFNNWGQLHPFNGSMDQARIYPYIINHNQANALFDELQANAPNPSLSYTNNKFCLGQPDTIAVSGIPQNNCFEYYWLLNGNVRAEDSLTFYYIHEDPQADTLQFVYGNDVICDFDTLRVILAAEYPEETVYDTICGNQFYAFNGQLLNTQGIYNDTIPGQYCDTIKQLNLAVLPHDSIWNIDSICVGDSMLFNGQWYKESGQYSVTYVNEVGCDSVIALDLTATFVSSDTTTASICQGDSFFYDGEFQTESAFFPDTIKGFPCDSLKVFELIVNAPDSTVVFDTICVGTSVLLAGDYQSESGLYVDSFKNQLGCDSLRLTTLEVEFAIDSLFAIIRPGQEFEFNEIRYSEAGTYIDTLASTGCDTVFVIQIEDEEGACGIYLPNSFSPDGDGRNDEFKIETECNFYQFELTIFDRWGREVFHTEDQHQAWDGNISGYQATQGVYQLLLQYQVVEDSKVFIKRPSLNLLR